MQNSYGLVKIGRSVDPARRCRALQSRERCEIQIVAVIPGEGANEEYYHCQLRDYWIEGEWFSGCDESLAAIVQTMQLGDVKWPFDLKATDASQWLSEFKSWRGDRKLIKQFDREIRLLINAQDSHRVHDASIWWLVKYGELKRNSTNLHVIRARSPGEPDYELVERGRRTGRTIPFYTSEVAAAMTLWPNDCRPEKWEGSAVSCCVAALKARKVRLPKG